MTDSETPPKPEPSTKLDESPLPYPDQLSALQETHPFCSKVLSKAQENRTRRLSRLVEGVRLRGLEELLGQLASYEATYRGDTRLEKASFLIARTTAYFAVGLEASLSGMHSVVHDSMRGVMEIEFLLRDFAASPSHVEEWLTWSEKTRRKKFDPRVLRQRHADRLGKEVQDVSEAVDYKAHSQMIHVTPRPHPLASVGITDDASGIDPFSSDACFWEMYEHARRVLWAAYQFAKALSPDAALASPEEFNSFRTGWERTSEWQSIFFALIQGGREDSESEDST
ncbi:hypothetical protein [Corallococcus sp. CA041A]|uniref:hypothetical protein n=1 Tax=Corallococcus TaxID=83461 RepID=UPI0011C48C9B|nr:hypothetical protein [Corallococcus sp. CA041A]